MSIDREGLSEKEAAEVTGFSVRTLQRFRAEGGGPKFFPGRNGAIRYRKEELMRWMKAREVSSTSEAVVKGFKKAR